MTEERDMEVEALSAIYMDHFNSLSSDHVQITLLPNPGGDDNFVEIILDIIFSVDYPNSIPMIDLIPNKGLEKEDILELQSKVLEEAENNIGTSMIFILAGLIKEWLDENNVDPDLEVEEEESSSEEEEEEEKGFEGTPVTQEAFLAWRKKFIEETKPFKKETKHSKLTGRQLFEQDKSLDASDTKFMEEGEEASNISAASIKPKIEEVAAQVDWTLFADEEIKDVEYDDEDN